MAAGASSEDWWRGAVIYQVYPRSFQDTNGDGIGDLRGIAERLPHIASLGVDAVWISPFFASPMKDYGYDVADYRAVDPMFGTIADFDRLLERAHGLGLKVMIDMVLSHSSDRHPWFLESREDRTNPRADWYVWADARPDGTPPSNWLSIFGGSAWAWEPRRGQYYLHNFLKEQPDLNLRNPALVEALLADCAFWLDRGVDGFRLDAIDFALHDPELRDNPARPPDEPLPGGLRRGEPYTMQRQTYSKTWRDVPERLLGPLRALVERSPGRVVLGELSGEDAMVRIGQWTSGSQGLHMAYSFDLLSCPFTVAGIRSVFERLEPHLSDGWPCWSFANHDVERPVTRFGGRAPDRRLACLLPAVLGSLRGSICLYQGEELGLPQAEIAYEDLQDPVGITSWPRHKGRDGARTPMPWEKDRPHAGFGEAPPWLPVPAAHAALAVDVQEAEPGSTLHRTRQFLRWRAEQPALIRGSLRFLETDEPVLAFERTDGARTILCAFNLSDEPAELPVDAALSPLDGHGFAAAIENGRLRLPAFEAFFGLQQRET